ncbi:MAG: hypothetical protein WCQ99_14730, partial [Pseudomonadota bacterium]
MKNSTDFATMKKQCEDRAAAEAKAFEKLEPETPAKRATSYRELVDIEFDKNGKAVKKRPCGEAQEEQAGQEQEPDEEAEQEGLNT